MPDLELIFGDSSRSLGVAGRPGAGRDARSSRGATRGLCAVRLAAVWLAAIVLIPVATPPAAAQQAHSAAPRAPSAAQPAPSASPRAPSTLEDRIERVENGLLTSTIIAGQGGQGLPLAERMQFYNVPGVSIAVVHDGKIEWARGYGVLAVGGHEQVDSATLFQAASISKPVAAMAALRMVEEGRITLDGDVNEWLRSWKVPDAEVTAIEKVTLRRLLSHDAGLTVHGFRGYASDEPVPTLVQLLDGAEPANSGAVRPDLVPGSQWRYSGGGTSVAQLLMMDLTAQSFADFVKEQVLLPAGMTRSSYEQPLPRTLAPRAATGHRRDGSPIAGGWHTYPEQAAAGLWTTPSDLARLVLEVQRSLRGESNRILSPEMTREMLTLQSGAYGIGFGLSEEGGEPVFHHGGANEGFRAFMVGFRDAGQGAVIMTNGDEGGALYMEILRSIAQEYGWSAFQPTERVTAPVDPRALEDVAGIYGFDFRGETHRITISENGEILQADLPHFGGAREAHPFATDRYFFLETDGVLAFERNDSGAVERVRVIGFGQPFVAERMRFTPFTTR